jgi:hypothetical protein
MQEVAVQQLDAHELARVIRELGECPALVRWIFNSREENRGYLEGAPPEDLKDLQGQNKTLNQILDKVPDK